MNTMKAMTAIATMMTAMIRPVPERAGAAEFQSAGYGARQGCNDAREDDQRNAVTDARVP
jgi:hypothetical protein